MGLGIVAFYSAIQLPDYSITQLLDSIVRGVMKTWIVFVTALIAGVWGSMAAQPQSLRIFIRCGPKTPAPGLHVLATAPLPSTHAGEIVPQIWTYENTLPGGQPYRSFVLMEGHHYANFSVPEFQTLILRAVAWAGKRPVDSLTGPR